MDNRQKANEWGAKAYEILMAEELQRQEEIKREKELADNPETFIDKANKGDVDAILKLKDFAKDGNKKAKDALEKLYWDGNKEHAVGTVVIRDGITKIDADSFRGCKKLEKIVLPDSLTEIGAGAFSHCTALTEINLPDSLNKIGKYAFYGCTGLTEIKFPDSLTSIGKSAFEGCENLEGISLPELLQANNVGERAFWNCRGSIGFGKNFDARAIGSIFGDKWRWLEEMMMDYR